MTDPKREAAVAALAGAIREKHGPDSALYRNVLITALARELLDAMLANPQPFLAVLAPQLRALLTEAFDMERATSEGNGWSNVHSREFVIGRTIAALTETAAEPARSKEPT